ncbi:MAG: AMP-binding protein [Deltaproteobacteria bacterium]|jgi:fatty-acyl-CoA synthase|nr:AMP-binding protein [Deltaproteobacteria bacterium]
MYVEPFVLREKTLGDLLDEAIARAPDTDAVVYVDRDYRLNWKDFGEEVDTLAKGLMALGIQKGEKIAVWAPNVPFWVGMMFASARIGAILLTVNTSYRENEVEYLLRHSECENLIVVDGLRDHDYLQTIHKIVPEIRTRPRGEIHSERVPHLRRVIFLGVEKHRGMFSIPEVKALSVMTDEKAYEARKASVSPYDVVNMQYTSGTTGFPKGVMLSHINIGNNGYWIGYHQGFGPKDRICLPVPLFHCFGCVLGVMAAVNHCASMIILESFNPVQVMTAVEQEKCTALYGVPTMFIAVLEHRIFDRIDFSSLRTGIMAGSVCPEPLMRRVFEKMNLTEITNVYGLTESSPGMTQTHRDEEFVRRVTTVGRHMPGVEVIIADPETGLEAPRGEQGEVRCRGYNVMQGYYNMPEETAKAITPEGWLCSGDLGVMDEEGYVVITGRIKDMIIRGGENIYPREVEEFLAGMEGVKDVQVVGVPSRKYGEEVGAFIIPKDGVEVLPEDVRDFCRGRIAWHKVPRYVALVREYPLTASGKVQKYLLRQMAGEMFPEAMQEKVA